MKHSKLANRIAFNIRHQRTLQKLSLGETARRTGISYQMLTDVEKRRRMPSIITLEKIAKAFNQDPAEFLR